MKEKKYHIWIQNEKHIDALCYLTEEELIKIIKDQIKKHKKVIMNIEDQEELERKYKKCLKE